MIQDLIDATPEGGVCHLPAGSVKVPEGTSWKVRRSITLVPHDTIISVVAANGAPSTAVPTAHLFDLSALPNGSRFELRRGLVVCGPDTSAWHLNDESPFSVFGWVWAKTWDSTCIIDGLVTTGGYNAAVYRSGGGFMSVTNSLLQAWQQPVAFMESTGRAAAGALVMRDVDLVAPPVSKFSSIGVYAHPHLSVAAERVTATGWGRFAFYLNGSPQSSGHHQFVECEAHDCSLIQTGSSSETTLIRCSETGTPSNGNSYVKGPLVSYGTRWASSGGIGFGSGAGARRVFIRDTIERDAGTFIAAGGGVLGEVEMIDCDVVLSGRSTLLKLTGACDVDATIIRGTLDHRSSIWALNLEGGRCTLIDADVGSVRLAGGQLVRVTP